MGNDPRSGRLDFRRSGAISVWLVASLAAPSALGGNDDSVLIGNEAALSGGAVTATASDGNALWYNPAGVAWVDRPTVDVNGSVFMLRYYKASPLLKADTGESADGDVVEFISIPNGLSYVRLLNEDLRLAYGIFVSQALSVTVRDRLTLRGPTSDTEWLVSFGIATQTYHGGAGLACRLTPTLRFGASLFLLFDRRSVRNQLAGGTIAPDTEQAFDFVSRAGQARRSAVGLEARVGVQ